MMKINLKSKILKKVIPKVIQIAMMKMTEMEGSLSLF